MYYKFNQEKLMFEPTNVSSKIAKSVGVVLGIIMILGFTQYPSDNLENLTQEEKLVIIHEHNEFSEEKLIEKIKQLNFKFPHIIMAQAILESGNFTSSVFLENNNMFGMKEAKSRANLAKGTNRSHAYYDDWEDCVLDYALYYSTYLSKLKTEDEYFQYLRQNYAADPDYVKRLKNIINKYDLKNKFND